MKFTLLLLLAFSFSGLGIAQVGINNTDPSAELDIITTNTGIPALELNPQSNPTGSVTGQLSVIGDKLYMYDATRGKWLTVETTALQFGQNGNTNNGRIAFGGSLRNNNSGAPMAFDGTIVAIAITSNSSLNKLINLRINGSNVADSVDPTVDGEIDLVSGSFANNAYNINFSAGDYLSLHVANDGLGDLNGSGAIIWIKQRQ